MKNFNIIWEQYRMFYENPENFGNEENLGVDAVDVITFVYQIETDAIIFGNVGQKIMHSEMLRYLIMGGDQKSFNIFGKIDDTKMDITDFVTGRLWINNDKISIWDYSDNYEQFSNDQYVRSLIYKIGKLINKNTPININNYEIEVTPSIKQNEERRLSF